MSTKKPLVELYTDGACSGNPGPGGWAYILKHPQSGKESENSGGEGSTTNNRMELSAVIEGLIALDNPCKVEVYSDNHYGRFIVHLSFLHVEVHPFLQFC